MLFDDKEWAKLESRRRNELQQSCSLLQLCSEEMWRAVMAQIVMLKIVPMELPEEALTQIFQVRTGSRTVHPSAVPHIDCR